MQYDVHDFDIDKLEHGITRLFVPSKGRFVHLTTISYLIGTIGRPSLMKTIESIELQPGDEILINYKAEPPGTWGHTERNELMGVSACAWLSFIDDDDWYLPGHRAIQEDAILTQPGGRDVPTIFKMRFLDGTTIWDDAKRDPNRPERPDLMCGNVGTPMLMMPNIPHMLGTFGMRYVGDFDFINGCKWPRRLHYWRPEVLVQVGNNPRGAQTQYIDFQKES